VSWLAELLFRRPRRILLLGGLTFLAAGVIAGSVFDVLKPFGFEDPDSESIIAREELADAAGSDPAPGLIALVELKGPERSAASRQQVGSVARALRSEDQVARTLTFYDTGDRSFLSRDGRSTYVAGFFRDGVPDEDQQEVGNRLKDKLADREDVTLGGLAVSYEEIGSQVEEDLQKAELIAFPILFLLSLWIFRSPVAALLPLMVGGLSIVGALAGLRAGAEVTELSIFAVNLITGLGLGLAVDYSLFVVSRYREELARQGPGKEALVRTMQTAGRTVLFSAITVAAALASLSIFPQRFLYSMGVGGSLVALLSGAVTLTVLPALLAVLGDRVNAGAPRRLRRSAEEHARPATSGGWYQLSQAVMRRPLPIATGAAVVMIAIGLPFLGVKFTFADAGILPTEATSRQVDDAFERGFPPNRELPIQLQVEAGADQRRAAAQLARRARATDGVAEIRGPVPVGRDDQRIDVFYDPDPYSSSSQELVRDLRELQTPLAYRVGGIPAEFVDQNESLLDHLPFALALLVTTTLIVLFLMTGSVILPVKALIMNLLTISAAFGVLVVVFQDGRFEDLLAYTSQEALDSSNALLIFAVAFGLSTDYGVFLINRIKEARDSGASDSDAVAIGMERTGRVVTAAALLLCVALGALVISKIIFIKQFGVGTVTAVLVDATIVRALLVPSLMQMLGRWNWWAPKPLRRLHYRFGLSDTTTEPKRA
jgi:RND superfamily putative drug exporter